MSLTDGKNQTTRWGYDQFGRVTNKTDQSGVVILKYTYDPNDRLTNRWSAAKGTTVYQTDPVGNVTNIIYPNDLPVSFGFDPFNRLTNMVDLSGTTAFSYTSGGQLLTEDGPFVNDTITNTYLNRLRTQLYLQQRAGFWTNAFSYDAAKRLTDVTSPAGSFGYAFAQVGVTPHPSLVSLPNTSFITNHFDAVARQDATYLITSGGTVLDSYVYAYNPANQRTNVTRLDRSTVAFGYDNIGQLTAANSSTNTENRGYKYDAAWNLNWLTNNGSASQFQVNTLNELTNAPSSVGMQIYDGNGNVLTNQGGDRAFVYDDENRLIQFFRFNLAGTSSNLLTRFVYDGIGRLRIRIEAHREDAPPPLPNGIDSILPANWVSDSETHYIYDGWRVIQERDSNNLQVVSYTRGTDLSGSPEGAGGIGGLLARSQFGSGSWTNHDFYFADANGNITALVNTSQSLSASYRYDPFGNIISESGIMADANVYRFSSKEIGTNTGMYYYGYRFYDPSLQRWINRDPIEEKGGLNLYGFVANDTMRFVDIWGLDIDSIHASASNPEAAEILSEVKEEQAALKELAKKCTKKIGKIADKLKRSNKEIKDAIHDVKHAAKLEGNPNVFVDTTTGNVHVETPGGNIGDIIGNVFDFLK